MHKKLSELKIEENLNCGLMFIKEKFVIVTEKNKNLKPYLNQVQCRRPKNKSATVLICPLEILLLQSFITFSPLVRGL